MTVYEMITNQIIERINEAEKLGFSEVIFPKQCLSKLGKTDYKIQWIRT